MKAIQFLPLLMIVTLFTFSCTKDNVDIQDDKTPFSSMTSLDANNTSKAGDLSDGAALSSLDWAWKSSIDCFAPHAADRYSGNHVFYTIQLPADYKLTVNLIPEDAKDEMSLYAYSSAGGTATLPESLASCLSCKTDPASVDARNRTIELKATTIFEELPQSHHTLVIGVAGAEGVLTGAYTLEVKFD